MTSRPAPKRRAEKPKRGISRPSDSTTPNASAATSGRRVAGRTASPAGEATRSPQIHPTPLPASAVETTLIRTEITAVRTEVAPQAEVSRPQPALPQLPSAIDSSAGSSATPPARDQPSAPGRRARRSEPEVAQSAPRESAPRESAPTGSTTASSYRGKRAAELPPIPAESTATIDAVSEHTTITERRSGEMRTARRATPPGSRSAHTRTRRFPGLPTPAVIGAAALVVAGFGAVAMSSAKPPVMETADFKALSADVSGGAAAKRYDPNNVDVTRDFDRALIAKQAEQQAAQRSTALSQLADKTEARSQEIKKKQWVLPLTGYRLTARFGQSSSLWSTTHTGLDFAAPSGTPLVAIARGTVTSTGFDGAYGNKTVLTLEDGTQIWYCHQSSVKASVGDSVAPGNVIGYVGSTGNVTGPHLHLEVRPTPDTPVDPMTALREHNVFP
ncbi:peptidoglycan DD-metalloendopeptidase family protein [Mumia sp.]|uniref:M23 family metallopeptidase n=1 Tax=Mumia sp. TaxID=1965300 RepID=UPI0026201580|nr:peptidoglycan DD-metalloendopeptidase family protein [Mumia sp.]MDD9348611.1 peptidoglycan DD-metalloendopeptidase family protein [Mumia sp.]